MKDNISVCSGCDKQTDDNNETKWDKYGNPYCQQCYNKLSNSEKEQVKRD